ncbi:MAG: response regulator [Bdellovibrionales bacterium]|nr:response regulator [Bdellovibrionales bacterium]
MGKSRILVVEDEAAVSLDIEEALRHLGYEVTSVVDTGEEAVLAVEKDKPDLVLMDIILKGEMDGIEAAAHIRDRYKIPVVYLTAHADESTLRRAKVTTPYGYILKPFQELELKPAIELALDRLRSEISPFGKGQSSPFETGLKEIKSAIELYNRTSPFDTIPEETRQALAKSSQLKSVAAGKYIAYEGESDVNAFLVATGRVVMLKSSASGKELIVDFVPPGDIFPLAVAMEEGDYPLSAKTQIDSKILYVPKSALRLVLEDFPKAYRTVSAQIARRLRESFDMARRLAHERVEVRVASALLGLHERLGIKSPCEEAFVLELTRKELADLTGTTPETASRVSKAMESDGLIDLNQAGIVIVENPAGLEAIISA